MMNEPEFKDYKEKQRYFEQRNKMGRILWDGSKGTYNKENEKRKKLNAQVAFAKLKSRMLRPTEVQK
jgi:hypothetical protein